MLALCAEAGLAKVGVDRDRRHQGRTPTPAATPRVDYEQIAREILEEADAIDAAEDELYGDARGDELPPELADRAGPARVAARGQRRLDEPSAPSEAAADPALAPKRLQEAKRRLEEELWTERRANAGL